MKVNVKGLVFVGFAAAVFAQSALAAAPSDPTASDLKTVSSKAYVDSKFNGNAGQVITQGTNRGDTTYTNVGNTGSYVDSTAGNNVLVTGKAVKEAMDASLGALAADETYISIETTESGGVTTKTVRPKQTPASLATDLTGTLTNGIPGSLSETAGQKIVTAAAVKALVDAESSADSTTINSASTNGVVPTSKNVYDFVTGAIDTAGELYQRKLDSNETAIYVGKYDTDSDWKALEAVTTNDQAATDYVTIKWNSTGNVYEVNLDSGHIAATSALTGATATNDTGLVTAGSIRSTILQAGDTAGGTINATTGAVDTTVPTTRNVYEFVTNYAHDNYQPVIDSTNAGKVMIGYNTQGGTAGNYTYSSNWRELVGDYTLNASNEYDGGYIQVAPNPENSNRADVILRNVGHAGTDISSAISSDATNNKDKIASAYAVQEYVQSLLNGNVLPAADSDCQLDTQGNTGITSSNGKACALVMSYDATNSSVGLKWIPMAQ